MPEDQVIIPLRWWHLSAGEKEIVTLLMPPDYLPWELHYGFYVRNEDGDVCYCEDRAVH